MESLDYHLALPISSIGRARVTRTTRIEREIKIAFEVPYTSAIFRYKLGNYQYVVLSLFFDMDYIVSEIDYEVCINVKNPENRLQCMEYTAKLSSSELIISRTVVKKPEQNIVTQLKEVIGKIKLLVTAPALTLHDVISLFTKNKLLDTIAGFFKKAVKAIFGVFLV